MKTLLFWVLNHIQNWNDERVKCKVCRKPLYGIDVKHVELGYNRCTCSKMCERKMAYSNSSYRLQAKYNVTNAFQIPYVKEKLNNKKE